MTGVAGFIGSHVADALIDRGDQVWGIDNFQTGREGNVPDEVSFAEGDITDEWTVDALLERTDPDVIVHAAATYADPDDWHRDIAVNADATAMIADRAAVATGSRNRCMLRVRSSPEPRVVCCGLCRRTIRRS